mmetsp:Transcript_21179/g.72931  ORF Transcript_21179/g.72931 Transcript_21179/m.72931 type:complete len:209 (+) Transcript_21179:480-1106(+)
MRNSVKATASSSPSPSPLANIAAAVGDGGRRRSEPAAGEEASTTMATKAVVSSALPGRLRCLAASASWGPLAFTTSVLTLAMAASTRAWAACWRTNTSAARLPEAWRSAGSPVSANLPRARVQLDSASLLASSALKPRLPVHNPRQNSSKMDTISSSSKLSKMPSLPMTMRSPGSQPTVFIRAPLMTKCVSAGFVFAKRISWTGLFAS